MYTYKELKERAAVLLQRSDDSTYLTKINTWINFGVKRLYDSYDYYDELKGVHNFTTVDGTIKYYLPSDFGVPFRLYDITNNKKINPEVEQDYFDANIANIADATESDAETYYFKEVVGVKVQVATTGDTLQAKSSSASDTAVTVRVEGYVDSDLTILGFEDIVVTGTTAVAGVKTFYKITHVSKDKDSVGYITLEDSSGTDLGILTSIDRVLRYKVIELRLIPDDSVTSMRMLYKKKYRRLVNDNDYCFVEADDFLIWNAVAIGRTEEKERGDLIQDATARAELAFNGILEQQGNSLGTDYQRKMETTFNQAFRTR